MLNSNTNQYLTFNLDHEIYALDINNVREVLDFSEVTRVPRMPEFILGVINLRGGVVPVVDLRLKLGISKAKKTVDTCIIIIEVKVESEDTLLGVVVDSVQEVINLESSQIEPAPRIGTRLKTNFIHGMGKKDEDFIIILNIEKVFSCEELEVVQSIESESLVEAAS